jgi:hypothetical protein
MENGYVVEQYEEPNPSGGALFLFQQGDAKLLLYYDDALWVYEVYHHVFEAAACKKKKYIYIKWFK